jgi:hypothetical protein
MVSSIVPGATGANALAADMRLARGAPQPQRREDAAAGDRVELSGTSIAQARESVRAGMMQVHEALAAGHDAQAMLVKVQALAKSGEAGAQGELDATLSAFRQRIEAAIARGADVLSGAAVAIQAEPGAAPVTVAGVDLTMKSNPGADDLLAVSANAQAEDPGLPEAVQRSLEKLQDAMSRLLDSVRALEAHQGFLGAAEAATAGGDMGADGARLLALQVRQGLEKSGAPIANIEPQAVLSLFRA